MVASRWTTPETASVCRTERASVDSIAPNPRSAMCVSSCVRDLPKITHRLRLRWGLRPCGVCLPPLKGPVQGGQSLVVLFVAYVLQPIDDLAVELFLDGGMRHGRGRSGTVPMLLARREPDHVAGMDFLDRAALPLDPAATGRDDQGLPQRVGVPRRPAPGSNVTLAPAARAGACTWNSGSMRTVPVNQSAGPLLEGCEPLLLISM